MATYDWIIGLGIVFGFSFVMSMLVRKDGFTFITFAVITCAFMVLAGYLNIGVLVLFIIFYVALIYFEVKIRGKS